MIMGGSLDTLGVRPTRKTVCMYEICYGCMEDGVHIRWNRTGVGGDGAGWKMQCAKEIEGETVLLCNKKGGAMQID